MLNPREVQDVIDDVLGNKKDPLRHTRDFLKQVSDHTDRVHRLEKKLEALIREKNSCGGNWARAYSVLERIEEMERLVRSSKELLTVTVNEATDAISKLDDEDQRMILTLRYVNCISDWDEIAEKSEKSKAAARRIHTAALKEMNHVLAEIETERNAD